MAAAGRAQAADSAIATIDPTSTLPARDISAKERAWFSADSGSGVVRGPVARRAQTVADWLRKIDRLLEDEALIDVGAQALEARWPQLEGLRTAYRIDSPRQDRQTDRVRQAGDDSRIGTSSRCTKCTGGDRRTSPCERRRWIGITRSSAARRIWPLAIADSPPLAMNKPP